MKLFLFALVAGLGAAPALGQHEGHTMPDPSPELPASGVQSPSESATPDPHAGHDMGPMTQADPSPTPDPHAGHNMPASAADPHEGHDMSAMGTASTPAPPQAPPPPEAFSGPRHAAETLFDPQVMAATREDLRAENGEFRTLGFMADRWEARIRDGSEGYLWDAQAWYGGDINKLWVKSEGEGDFDESVEELELQALWSRAFLPWWDFQIGVRHDFRPGPERTHLALGLQGLVPYQSEVDAAVFLSEDGDLSARLEAEYDQRITQRLILQPRLEFELEGQDVPELGIGSGLSAGELGLRLRYEFAREFAPYIGAEYERRFGDTASFARAAGEDAGGWNFLLGVRAWF